MRLLTVFQVLPEEFLQVLNVTGRLYVSSFYFTLEPVEGLIGNRAIQRALIFVFPEIA